VLIRTSPNLCWVTAKPLEDPISCGVGVIYRGPRQRGLRRRGLSNLIAFIAVVSKIIEISRWVEMPAKSCWDGDQTPNEGDVFFVRLRRASVADDDALDSKGAIMRPWSVACRVCGSTRLAGCVGRLSKTCSAAVPVTLAAGYEVEIHCMWIGA